MLADSVSMAMMLVRGEPDAGRAGRVRPARGLRLRARRDRRRHRQIHRRRSGRSRIGPGRTCRPGGPDSPGTTPRPRRRCREFLAAAATGDLQALMDVLAPDVVLLADGGGKVSREPAAGQYRGQGGQVPARHHAKLALETHSGSRGGQRPARRTDLPGRRAGFRADRRGGGRPDQPRLPRPQSRQTGLRPGSPKRCSASPSGWREHTAAGRGAGVSLQRPIHRCGQHVEKSARKYFRVC